MYCCTYEDAHEGLTKTVLWFGHYMKLAFDLWLHAADMLQTRQQQHPHTAAAVQLVQAALREAPSPLVKSNPKVAAWMQKHLPGISKAMQDSVSSQMGISDRRLRIAHTLIQQPGSTQQVVDVARERDAYTEMEILAGVLNFVLPVATLCSELALASMVMARSSTSHGHREQGRPQPLQHRARLGWALILRVTHTLRQKRLVKKQLWERRLRLSASMLGLGSAEKEMPEELHRTLKVLVELQMLACYSWVLLAYCLAPEHEDILLFLDHVEWGWLQHREAMQEDIVEEVKSLLFKLHDRQGLCAYMWEHVPDALPVLLDFMGLTPEQISAGLPAAAQQQLAAKIWEATGGSLGGDLSQGTSSSQSADHQPSSSSSSSSTSSTGSGRVTGHSSLEAEAAEHTQVSEECNDMGDMQALLQMMYGCTIKEHDEVIDTP